MIDNYYNITELSDFLGVSKSTINRKLKDGLPSVKLGKFRTSRRLFSRPDVEKYLSQIASNNSEGEPAEKSCPLRFLLGGRDDQLFYWYFCQFNFSRLQRGA